MAILVIGNGFDLAHHLPTQYSDFLEFVKVFKTAICGDKDSIPHDDFHNNLLLFVNGFKSDNSPSFQDAFKILTTRNLLLDYFLGVYEQRCAEGKKGWIDFESEIASIIKLLDRARDEEKEGKRRMSREIQESLSPFIPVRENSARYSDYIENVAGSNEEMATSLYQNLSDITKLLEIYLVEYVENLEVKEALAIERMGQSVSVLSFNYTNTFQRLYGNDKTQYCYYHGKAHKDDSTCELVLGIDEYLDDERRNKDNAFIKFKKFFQRIYKDTDSSIVDWLDQHQKENMVISKMYDPSIINIYFYGHSLDVTDKDILRQIFLHENAVKFIFYRDDNDREQKIINLVKIIDEDNLISMTRGEKKEIRFIPVNEWLM